MQSNKMSCIFCKQLPKDDNFTRNDCVLSALENIKVHYLSLKNVVSLRDKELQKLQQRNEKLVKAVELLQREQLRASLSCISQESPQRIRGIPTRGSTGEKDSNGENAAGVIPLNADTTAEDLNMALNSEQIFSCSSADTSTQLSPNHNESISETEELNNPPRVLRTTFEMRREMQNKRKPSPLKCNENIAPVAVGSAGVKKTNSGWIGKEKQASNNSFCVKDVKTTGNFAKPLSVNLSKVERKPSLSLKRPPKLKQTRLQLDVSREKSFTGSDSTFCEEVIDASPIPNAMKKQEKPARSWLLRVNSSVKNVPNKADQSKCPEGRTLSLHADDEDLGDVFDFSFKPTTPEHKKSSDTLPDSDPFKLANSPEKAVKSMLSKEIDSSSSSVMILSPPTQEIIFLDDSYNDNTHIESMDLLQDLLKCDDESLENLKRIESEKIKKLQKTASAAPKLETNVVFKQHFNSVAEDSKVKSLPTNAETAKQSELKVKQEKVTEEPIPPTSKLKAVKRKSKDVSSEEEEEDHDHMPQPLIVKQEKLEDVITKQVPEINNKPLSIKERFKIDCRDCQQYIDFLGERMTDKEIIEHLKRCTRHQRKDVLNSTPDGFWNPFIATFDANDPRNETLIDSRFCNKNK